MRASILSLAIVLGACVAPPPQIAGPYASSLSATDIDEIKALSTDYAARPHTRVADRPWRFTVVRPDYVRVDAPIVDPYASTSSFDVMRRHGRWVVDGHGGGVRGLAPGENVIVY
jgi:hypothetical protein